MSVVERHTSLPPQSERSAFFEHVPELHGNTEDFGNHDTLVYLSSTRFVIAAVNKEKNSMVRAQYKVSEGGSFELIDAQTVIDAFDGNGVLKFDVLR